MTDSAASGFEQSAHTHSARSASAESGSCSLPGKREQDASAAQPGSPRGEQQRACRVPGCSEPLKAGICAVHYAAPSLVLDGELHRFCQQASLSLAHRGCRGAEAGVHSVPGQRNKCGQVHLLSAFDADRRSCRDSLRRHQDCRLARKRRARQRAQQAQAEAAAAAGAAAAPKAAARPRAAPAAKAGAPKVVPAKASAPGQATTAGAAESAKPAKRKRQARGPQAGPQKQQKLQQQDRNGGQEQQHPQPQLQPKASAGKQGLPAAKLARSQAAPSSDGSTQDRMETCFEEPSLPLSVPSAAPSHPHVAARPAATPAPPALLPQQSCSPPPAPLVEAVVPPLTGQAAEEKASGEPELAVVAAAEPAMAAVPATEPVVAVVAAPDPALAVVAPAAARKQPSSPAPPQPPSQLPSPPLLAEPPLLQQQQPAARECSPDSQPWAEWHRLAGQLEAQVPPQQALLAQRGAAGHALLAMAPQPPQPLLLHQALQLMDTPVAGLPDVPSLDELLIISSGMGFDLQPSSPAHVQPLHRPAWPPIRLHAAAAAAIPSAAAAAPAAVAAPKGGCTEHSLPAGWQPGPETPTSAEQVPCHITVMERPGASRMDRPSVRVYEVTRSSQRCCWQLSCEFSGAAAAAQCH
ncbi:hypothetical protein ABPG77_006665 [Micractinium sp. CCAP 211/92]